MNWIFTVSKIENNEYLKGIRIGGRQKKSLNPEKARASFLAVFLPGLIIPFWRQIFQKLLELDLRFIFRLKKFGLFRDSAITWPTVNLVLALKNSSSWEKMAVVTNRLMSELMTPMWHLPAKDNDFRAGHMRKFRFFNFSLFYLIFVDIRKSRTPGIKITHFYIFFFWNPQLIPRFSKMGIFHSVFSGSQNFKI